MQEEVIVDEQPPTTPTDGNLAARLDELSVRLGEITARLADIETRLIPSTAGDKEPSPAHPWFRKVGGR